MTAFIGMCTLNLFTKVWDQLDHVPLAASRKVFCTDLSVQVISVSLELEGIHWNVHTQFV